MNSKTQKYRVLHDTFHYPVFRPGQEEIIDTILDHRDLLAILPTGGGKSICFQIPALIFPGLTLVISPLISLMKDQVEALQKRGIPAAYICSAQSPAEQRQILTDAVRGRYKLLYLSPERLHTKNFARFTAELNISFICIDESHCVSQWGREFRPSYYAVSDFITTLAVRPAIAAFTATASKKVQDDICQRLGLKDPMIISKGFDRPNLYYEVRRVQKKWPVLTELLKKYQNTCGIIYCLTRTTVEKLTEKLCQNGIPAVRYHGGLTSEERIRNQTDWIEGRVLLIVATNAFGMGIDKPDVRFVIHYNMPADPEGYYQEAGRAGRDGNPSDCILLFNDRDVKINRFFIQQQKNEVAKGAELAALNAMREYVTTAECLRRSLLTYFGQSAPAFCGNCSFCLSQKRPISKDSLSAAKRDSLNHLLYRELLAKRTTLAKQKNLRADKIISQQGLEDLALRHPHTVRDLLFMERVPFIFCKKYGTEFLEEIRAFDHLHSC